MNGPKKTVYELLKDIKHPDPKVRARAHVELAGRIGSRVDKFDFDKAAKDDAPEVRKAFYQLLGSNPDLVGRDEARHWLVGSLADSDAGVRKRGLDSLASLDPALSYVPAEAAFFFAALFDEDAELRRAAKAVVVKKLVVDLASGDPARQLRACSMAGHFGGAGEGREGRDGDGNGGDDPGGNGGQGNWDDGDLVDALLGLLAHPNPNVRIAALGALQQIEPRLLT